MRKSVKEFQQENLGSIIKRLEHDFMRQSSREISSAVSTESMQAKRMEMEQQQTFIKSLREMKATGRMQIHLALPQQLKNTDFDIILEDGDYLFIPMRKDVVHVAGAVMTPGSYVFRHNKDVSGYLDIAGGLNQFADGKNIYIVKVDGSARRVDSSFFSGNFLSALWKSNAFGENTRDLEPGDTIVVPEKFYEVAWLREIKDITQILMQIAVTTAVTIKLF